MKKLSKDDDKRLTELAENLRAEWSEIEGTKDAIEEALERYNEAVGKYNEIAGEAREMIEELAGRAQDYMSERSDKWQEGDAGQNYSSWVDALEGVELEDIEEVASENLGLADDPGHADTLDELPREPDA